MEHNIFISYNRCDIDVARIICDELKSQLSKSSFFFDIESFAVGEDFARMIVASINNADVFLCVIGENTLSSSWQMNEVKLAVQKYQHDKHSVTIIPIILPNVKLGDCCENPMLKGFHFFQYSSNVANEISLLITNNENTKEKHNDDGEKHKSKSHVSKTGCLLLVGVLLVLTIISSGLFIVSSSPEDGDNALPEEMAEESTDNISEPPIIDSDTQDGDIPQNDYNNSGDIPNVDFDDTNDIPNEEGIQDNVSEDENVIDSEGPNNWHVFLLGFLFGIAISLSYVLYKQKRKKSTLKVSANKNCAVSVDGEKHINLNKSEVGKIRLNAGKYIIDFVAEDQKSCKRYTSDIQQKGKDNAIVFDFGVEESKERKIINVFIAGSTKLEAERNAIRAGISMIYNKWRSHNFAIFSYTFEDFSKTLQINGQQSLYNKFIKEDADLAVFILDKKIGDKTRKEFDLAYNAYKSNGHPRILVYSKDCDVNTIDISEIQQLMDGINNYWTTYTDTEHLRLSFMETLNWDLISLYQEELKK